MNKLTAVLASLALTAGIAQAKPHPKPRKLEGMIVNVQNELAQLRSEGYHKPAYSAEKCAELAAENGKAEAKSLCGEYDKWVALASAQKDLSAYANLVLTAKSMRGTDSNVAAYREAADRCRARVDSALAAGAIANVAIPLGTDMTLSAARTQLCGALDSAGGVVANTAAVEKDRMAKVVARYKDAGATGERLDLLVAEDGAQWYAPGQVALGTLHEQAAAPVMFLVMQDTASGMWTVKRFQFDGNALKQTTSAQYDKKPSAKAFR